MRNVLRLCARTLVDRCYALRSHARTGGKTLLGVKCYVDGTDAGENKQGARCYMLHVGLRTARKNTLAATRYMLRATR